MNPVIGNASDIIAQALALGIYCRPAHWRSGDALAPHTTGFDIVSGSGIPDRPYTVTPEELTRDWSLVTKEIIEREWNSPCL